MKAIECLINDIFVTLQINNQNIGNFLLKYTQIHQTSQL
jgi:hypothetical protein